MTIDSEKTLPSDGRKDAFARSVGDSATGAPADTEASDLRLCLWAWVNADGRIITQTDDGFWEVQAFADERLDALVQRVRIPARADHLPDLAAPNWPAVRTALKRLQAMSFQGSRH